MRTPRQIEEKNLDRATKIIIAGVWIAMVGAFLLIYLFLNQSCIPEKDLERVADQCEMICDTIVQDRVDEVLEFCTVAINNALEYELSARVAQFLVANGCVSITVDQWDCSEASFCGTM